MPAGTVSIAFLNVELSNALCSNSKGFSISELIFVRLEQSANILNFDNQQLTC